MFSKVELTGINTSKLEVLSDERKTELLRKAKNGDKKAREELISGNLKLILSVVKSFANRGENPDDLFQVGCIGLIKAVDNFNIDLDVKFSTYAVPMIIGEIRRYMRDNNSIRISRSLKDLAYKALQTKEALAKRFDREPTIEEISNEMNMPKEEIINAFEAIVEPISFYEPIFNDSGDSLFVFDQIKDEINTTDRILNKIAVNEAISKLNTREKRIVLLRFYNGKTQTEVAEEIGISQAQVSRLEKNALNKIKKEI